MGPGKREVLHHPKPADYYAGKLKKISKKRPDIRGVLLPKNTISTVDFRLILG
jgi:hypothetical protein